MKSEAAQRQQQSWALTCLQQLLIGRVGLSHGRQQHQVSTVYAAYCQAVIQVATAAVRAQAGEGAGRAAQTRSIGLPAVVDALSLLVLLTEAAPGVRAGRQVKQRLQFGLMQQLSAVVGRLARDGAGQGGNPRVLHTWQQLAAVLDSL
jgi:hypothetical protein